MKLGLKKWQFFEIEQINQKNAKCSMSVFWLSKNNEVVDKKLSYMQKYEKLHKICIRQLNLSTKFFKSGHP